MQKSIYLRNGVGGAPQRGSGDGFAGCLSKKAALEQSPHFAVKSRSNGVPFVSLGSRPSFHFRLPLPVISATAPGVFAARRVWCRTSSCRNTHFDFPVGVGDFAMVPGVFSAPPFPVKDSLRGVLTLPASWISLSIALSPSVFLLAQVITSSRPGRNDPRVPSNQL